MQIIRTDFSAYFPDDFEQRERELFQTQNLGPYMKAQSFLQQNRLEKTDQLIVISNTQTDFKSWPESMWEKTQLLVHPNSGYDNFDPAWVTQRSFPIVIGHEIRAQAVAEYCLSAFTHRIASLPQQKAWSPGRQFPRNLMQEQSVLVVGRGHIGGRLVDWLEALGADVQIFDPYKNHYQLDLTRAQTVILACGLNPSSHHLIDRAFLKELPHGFTLINAARGGLVKTGDLIQALHEDPSACAYLDVFEKEPADLQELTQTPNLKATSHIAGVYNGLNQKVLDFETHVISDFLKMKPTEFRKIYRDQLLASRLHKGFLI